MLVARELCRRREEVGRPLRITTSDLERAAETRREIATRVHACVRELMADRDHDHVVITHGYAQTYVVTTWLQVPTDAVGFASLATRPGAITHLRHDDYWRNRAVVALADTSHLDDGLHDPHRQII